MVVRRAIDFKYQLNGERKLLVLTGATIALPIVLLGEGFYATLEDVGYPRNPLKVKSGVQFPYVVLCPLQLTGWGLDVE